MALGLAALGVRRGEVVGLIGRNRPNWVWGELAAHALGCMSLGIYEDVLAAEAGYLIDAARVGVVLCEDEEQVDKLLELDHSGVRLIVYHDDRGMSRYDDPAPRRLGRGSSRAGRELAGPGAAPVRGRDRAGAWRGRGDPVHHLGHHRRSPSSPCCSIGRSSRTSRPTCAPTRASPRDEYVSILPLPWIMEQVYAVAMPLLCRIRVSFPEEPRDGDARSAGDRPHPPAAGAPGLGADGGRCARTAHGRRRADAAAVRVGGPRRHRGRGARAPAPAGRPAAVLGPARPAGLRAI